MRAQLEAVKQLLKEVSAIKYIDEDWGQLDIVPAPPVKFPCALVSVEGASYSNLGKDSRRIPANRQEATVQLLIIFAQLKLSGSSATAPQVQRVNAATLWDIMEEAHARLQGRAPTGRAGAMVRTLLRPRRRDDGIQEYSVGYRFVVSDV